MLFRGVSGVRLSTTLGAGLQGALSESFLGTLGDPGTGRMSSRRGGVRLHESGRLINSIDR